MKLSVIKTGGKQYLVASGDTISIEKLSKKSKTGSKDLVKGDKIVFDEVLMTTDGNTVKIGKPAISGEKIEGEVVEAGRAKKIDVIHYKAKSRYFKKQGHRQPFLKVKIS